MYKITLRYREIKTARSLWFGFERNKRGNIRNELAVDRSGLNSAMDVHLFAYVCMQRVRVSRCISGAAVPAPLRYIKWLLRIQTHRRNECESNAINCTGPRGIIATIQHFILGAIHFAPLSLHYERSTIHTTPAILILNYF